MKTKKIIKKRKPKALHQEEDDSENDFQIMPHQKKKIRNVNRKKNTNKKKVIKSSIPMNEASNVDFQAQPVPCQSPKKQISIPKNNSNPKKITETEVTNIFAIKTLTDSKIVQQIIVPKKKPKFIISKILKESPCDERK